MKKYTVLGFAFIVLSTFQSNAQREELRGSAAKYYKSLKHNVLPVKVVYKIHNHKPLTGPKAKNSKPWQDSCKTLPIVILKRRYLRGTFAKNPYLARKLITPKLFKLGKGK